jgi:hypothetical protein
LSAFCKPYRRTYASTFKCTVSPTLITAVYGSVDRAFFCAIYPAHSSAFRESYDATHVITIYAAILFAFTSAI